MKRNSQSGVALVITLIFLSVITFMAISFLVLSRREAQAAVTVTQKTIAEMAADSALHHAMAQASAQMLSATNGYSFALIVSTNLDQPFLPPGTNNNIANVSYFDVNGNLLAGVPFLQNLRQLQILPRAPVFIKTTFNGVPTNEFRYFLDLNRNGIFDPSGYVIARNANGRPLTDINNNDITNLVVGDPQWIGVLDHPDQPHSSSNQFVARYCFIALPVGNSLDVNFIHNQSKFSKVPSDNFDGGYYRNENVGTWELNLAGFLASLNVNYWNPNANIYTYASNFLSPSSTGYAFEDASAILQVRYNNNYNNLTPLNRLYAGAGVYQFNNVDVYGNGPLMTGFFPPALSPSLTLPWSGADNRNAFFTPQDFFNLVPQNNPVNSFSNRLYSAGLGLSTYDRYTYYRMLQSMSFDSAPETTRNVAFAAGLNNGVVTPVSVTSTPLNLNYVNVNGVSATNFESWAVSNSATNGASMFFTNCADRLIRQEFPNPVAFVANGVTNIISLSITNIPLYPVNFYTPAVHRLLQLAANIYDAGTARVDSGLIYPSVFRPVFSRIGTNIFISGYVEEQKGMNSYGSIPLSLPDDLATVTAQVPVFPSTTPFAPPAVVNLYSAPWVLGVKKGFPNFNQFAMESVAQITRKLQVNKISAGTPRTGWLTNQMYIIGISNLVGIESWNSYMTNYNRPIQMIGTDYLSMTLSNDRGIRYTSILNNGQLSWFTNIAANAWKGYKDPLHTTTPQNALSFFVPLRTNILFLPDSIWNVGSSILIPTTNNPALITKFEQTGTFPLPQFGLLITNKLRYIMLDGPKGRIIDYVQMDGINSYQDLLAETLAASSSSTVFKQPGAVDSVWATNRPTGSTSISIPTVGILNQLAISAGNPSLNSSDWFSSQLPGANSTSEITKFSTFLNSPASNGNLVAQAPYTATKKITLQFMLQANDPLVHYTASDLGMTNFLNSIPPIYINNITLTNFGGLSTRYAPWVSKTADPNSFNLALKDPLIRCSDDWVFPTNVFANLGWLGRVHRGTPWQTVYLKSSIATLADWESYSGHTNPFVAVLTHPMNDWKIMDLFTTAPNDNATRGQLSINNTNEAAWHAVLDGVVVITNTGATTYAPLVLDPNMPGQPVSFMINAINATRTNYPGFMLTNGQVATVNTGAFTSLGQILSVPQLTVQSPFLNTNSLNSAGLFSITAGFNTTNINPLLSDAVYERIPQQIMSLLRVGSPRYVIFAYGQALKPADHSVFQGGGPYFGLVTNYAIVSETVTRTVVDFPNQIAPPPQLLNVVVPPVATPTTNYLGVAFLAPQPPPKALVKSFTQVPPQ